MNTRWSELKFRPEERRQGRKAVEANDEELKQLEALEKKEGKSKLDDN